MKCHLLIAALLATSVPVLCQTVSPPQTVVAPQTVLPPTPMQPAGNASVPASVTLQPNPQLPVPPPFTTQPDNIRYLNNPRLFVFCTSQVAEFNDRDADMIFIGDSITEGWRGPGEQVWEADFAPRNALDFGVSGDQTQHVLWRLDNFPIGRLHPKVAVVLIGTNNIQNSPQEIAAGVRAILDKLQILYPGIKIILNSIMPNRRATILMTDANVILRTFADNKNIFFLDLVPFMPPVGDNWTGLSSDHLHPNASGYQIWAVALLPLVDKLLPPPVTTPRTTP